MNKIGNANAQKETENIGNITNDLVEFVKKIDKLYNGGDYEQAITLCDQGEVNKK